jgi:hypothetical protein
VSTAYGGWTPAQTTPTANPSFTFTGLTPGTTYYGKLFSNTNSSSATYAMQVTLPLK